MDLKKILIQMDNYSEFCRDAVIEKFNRESNKQYLQLERRKHEEEIRKIDSQIKNVSETSNKFDSLMESCFKEYKRRIILAQSGDFEWSDTRFRQWVKDLYRENGILNVNEYKILDECKQRGGS